MNIIYRFVPLTFTITFPATGANQAAWDQLAASLPPVEQMDAEAAIAEAKRIFAEGLVEPNPVPPDPDDGGGPDVNTDPVLEPDDGDGEPAAGTEP